MSARSAALTAPGFRRLAFSYTVNDLGDTFGLVALAVLVLEQTNSALGTTALFVVCAVFFISREREFAVRL